MCTPYTVYHFFSYETKIFYSLKKQGFRKAGNRLAALNIAGYNSAGAMKTNRDNQHLGV